MLFGFFFFYISRNDVSRSCPFWFFTECLVARVFGFCCLWLWKFFKGFLWNQSQFLKHFHVLIHVGIRCREQFISGKNRISTCKKTQGLSFPTHLRTPCRKSYLRFG